MADIKRRIKLKGFPHAMCFTELIFDRTVYRSDCYWDDWEKEHNLDLTVIKRVRETTFVATAARPKRVGKEAAK